MKIFKIIILATVFLTLLGNSTFATNKLTDRVVAVVNNAVITKSDLDNRFKLILRMTKNSNKLSTKQQKLIYSRTLGSLIDEELYRQYAKNKGISISEMERTMAVRQFEARGKMPKGTFKKITHGLETTAMNQIDSDLLLQKIVAKEIYPRIIITNGELDNLIEQLAASAEIPEHEISHILIEVAEDQNDAEVKKQALDIYKKLKNGEDFTNIASIYSTDKSSNQGGYLGWFSETELNPVIATAVKPLKIGEISTPVRSSIGWHIVKLNNRRSTKTISTTPITEYRLVKLSMALDSNHTTKDFIKITKKLKRLSDLEELLEKKVSNPNFANSGDMGWVKEGDLSSRYMNALTKVSKGKFTKVLEDGSNIEILYLANKRSQLPPKLLKYRERVRSRILENRAELMTRRFIRNLRRTAFIDMRL